LEEAYQSGLIKEVGIFFAFLVVHSLMVSVMYWQGCNWQRPDILISIQSPAVKKR